MKNNENEKAVIKALINYLLEGGQTRGTKIKLRELFQYGIRDLALVDEALHEWRAQGYLVILKEPAECAPDDYCVEMLSFIDQKSPIKGWLNWQESPEAKSVPPRPNENIL